jgi:hypothetical protein
MAAWCVEKLGRIADTTIAFLLPSGHFSTQRGSFTKGELPLRGPQKVAVNERLGDLHGIQRRAFA